jgi:pyruvate/2-oxoglutarate/acetoin dehydrogenase E1 component
MVHKSMQATHILQGESIDAEVIDIRTLVPFDWVDRFRIGPQDRKADYR